MRKADNLPPSCAVVTKSWSLNFLKPSGPVQACNGTALPFYSHYLSSRTIIILSSHLRLGLQIISILQGPSSNSVNISLIPTRALCTPIHLILLDLMTQTIVGEEHKPCSSQLRIFPCLLSLHPSYLQVPSSAPYSPIPSAGILPFIEQTKFHAQRKQQTKL